MLSQTGPAIGRIMSINLYLLVIKVDGLPIIVVLFELAIRQHSVESFWSFSLTSFMHDDSPTVWKSKW
jgi:hypothetical protein